ncbi:MAG: Maf family protein, partial [Muribaculaceae bacterium]|nr:Maf family protein [Muribaculaceae bacterium]
MTQLENLKKYNIILASGSPRRRELLGMLDIPFRVMTGIDVDESYPSTLDSRQVPLFLANLKADAYLAEIKDNDLIITADTVVIVDNEVIGKPQNREDAI